jgi:hypothetical protein
MNKFRKSQVLMLFLLAVLLIITPLLSSSLRPTYLYFIINILIIALGAEAGLLSSFSKPSEDKKHTPKPLVSSEVSSDNGVVRNTYDKPVAAASTEKRPKVVEKSASERTVGSVKMDMVKKCPSMPSLFFIGGEDVADETYAEEEKEEEKVEVLEEEEVNGQELFTKAETFIGNFYQQLKMQREESWKKINGFYQNAF